MLTILVDQITPRLKYTFDFVFEQRGVDYTITKNNESFQSVKGTKLNYSAIVEGGISPISLLFEEGVRQYELDIVDFNGEECLSLNGELDPFASVFFVLSRYEEYLEQARDEHGRFAFKSSLLAKFDWVTKVVCDRWSETILKSIGVDSVSNACKIVPTFDIDNTYAYKLKTGKRKWLSVGKDVATANFHRLKERRLSIDIDPYDTFSKIEGIASKNENTKVFWLVGDLAEKDRNISTDIAAHSELIDYMDKVSNVSLHPSYASFKAESCISKEKNRLEKIIGRKVESSRQHFLRFELPITFRQLEGLEFKHEYSLGFAEHVGFRSGTARAHLWFDLEENRISELTLHPFAYMDGTLNEYMGLSPIESESVVQQLYGEVDSYGGDFIFIWHNETIGEYGKWKGWSRVLNFTLNLKK